MNNLLRFIILFLLGSYGFINFFDSQVFADADSQSYFFASNSQLTTGWLSFSCGPFSEVVYDSSYVGGPLSANTIYYLQSGFYNLSSPISMANCTVLRGLGNVVLYKNGGDIIVANSSNRIVQNISMSGNSNGVVASVSNNNLGLFNLKSIGNSFALSISNQLYFGIQKVVGYNIGTTSLNIVFSSGYYVKDVSFNNHSSFNTTIKLQNSSNGFFDNTIILSSFSKSIDLFSSTFNSFNNIQVLNGGGNGFNIDAGSTDNIFNNIFSYNNNGVGFYAESDNNVLNSVFTYNNSANGVELLGSNNNGYGALNFENNVGGSSNTGGLVVAVGSDPRGLGWVPGMQGQVDISCDWASNPIFAGVATLVNPCSTIGGLAGGVLDGFSFGGNINNQIQSVKWNGSNVVETSLSYDASKKIGDFPINWTDTPSSLSVSPVTCAQTGQTYQSNTINIVGIDIPSIILLSGDSSLKYSRGGPFGVGPGIAYPGDSITFQMSSSGGAGVITTGYISVGGLNTVFLIQTEPLCNPIVIGGGSVYSQCGNYIKDVFEECDDGNNLDGDGCSKSCNLEFESVCGDSILSYGEQCDDGNLFDGDGCSSTCGVGSISISSGNNLVSKKPKNILGNGFYGNGYDTYISAINDRLNWYKYLRNVCFFNDFDYSDISFIDLDGSKYSDSIRTLLGYCIVNGKAGIKNQRLFSPWDLATKAELVKMVAKIYAMGRGDDFLNNTKYSGFFKDVYVDSWYAKYFERSYLKGILDMFIVSDGFIKNIKPSENITIDDAIKFIINVMKRVGKPTESIEQIVNGFEDHSRLINRAQMAYLISNAFSLREDIGMVLRSKNYDFLDMLRKSLSGYDLKSQQTIISGLYLKLSSVGKDSLVPVGIYLSGLLEDLQLIYSKKPIPEYIYLLDDVRGNVLVSKKNIYPKSFKFTYLIVDGENSNSVRVLQMLLQDLGFYNGVVNGNFDQKTKSSVYQFQLANKILTANSSEGLRGLVGPATRDVLNKILSNINN